MGCTLKDKIKLDPTIPMNDEDDEGNKIDLSPSELGVNPQDESTPLSRGFVLGPDESYRSFLSPLTVSQSDCE